MFKAKIRSKQKAIVRAIVKVQKEEAEKKTTVKINELIGRLKIKIINMQNTFNKKDYITRSPSPTSRGSIHIKHFSAEYKEDQNIMVIRPSTRVSPVREEDVRRSLGLHTDDN